MLGCNDYLTWPYPSDSEFIDGYQAMLRKIVRAYTRTAQNASSSDDGPVIVNLCGGGSSNYRAPCANVKAASDSFQKNYYSKCHYIEIGEYWITVNDLGCLGHRNVRGQEKLVKHLAPKIGSIMGW